MCKDVKNFTNKAQLLKDKFSHIVNQNNQMNQQESGNGCGIYTQSINELKKMDLFDLGIVLTICATGGLDMINEDQLAKIADFGQECCLIHALNRVDPSEPGFDLSLLSTLISLRKILNRISPEAQDFICMCMQQRFTE